ncbi:LIM domain-binding protein 2 [Myotis brandtii]|uniref:LIM domain-binding protein 2 n=1 Tax=Myotis brandtii TaxID=109478 RepID=S7ND59_MYOBR|nr:LIM domain-binding protein 2 [Myotis brandtii]
MSSTPHDPFYSSPFGPFYRRHTPYMVQPEYRIYEMNKRLQSRTEDSDNLWWDAFATEFFEDDATLTLSFCLEDGPKRYSKSEVCFSDISSFCASKKTPGVFRDWHSADSLTVIPPLLTFLLPIKALS